MAQQTKTNVDDVLVYVSNVNYFNINKQKLQYINKYISVDHSKVVKKCIDINEQSNVAYVYHIKFAPLQKDLVLKFKSKQSKEKKKQTEQSYLKKKVDDLLCFIFPDNAFADSVSQLLVSQIKEIFKYHIQENPSITNNKNKSKIITSWKTKLFFVMALDLCYENIIRPNSYDINVSLNRLKKIIKSRINYFVVTRTYFGHTLKLNGIEACQLKTNNFTQLSWTEIYFDKRCAIKLQNMDCEENLLNFKADTYIESQFSVQLGYIADDLKQILDTDTQCKYATSQQLNIKKLLIKHRNEILQHISVSALVYNRNCQNWDAFVWSEVSKQDILYLIDNIDNVSIAIQSNIIKTKLIKEPHKGYLAAKQLLNLSDIGPLHHLIQDSYDSPYIAGILKKREEKGDALLVAKKRFTNKASENITNTKEADKKQMYTTIHLIKSIVTNYYEYDGARTGPPILPNIFGDSQSHQQFLDFHENAHQSFKPKASLTRELETNPKNYFLLGILTNFNYQIGTKIGANAYDFACDYGMHSVSVECWGKNNYHGVDSPARKYKKTIKKKKNKIRKHSHEYLAKDGKYIKQFTDAKERDLWRSIWKVYSCGRQQEYKKVGIRVAYTIKELLSVCHKFKTLPVYIATIPGVLEKGLIHFNPNVTFKCKQTKKLVNDATVNIRNKLFMSYDFSTYSSIYRYYNNQLIQYQSSITQSPQVLDHSQACHYCNYKVIEIRNCKLCGTAVNTHKFQNVWVCLKCLGMHPMACL